MAIALVLGAGVAWYFEVKDESFWMFAFLPVFFVGKLMLSFSAIRGGGVLALKDPSVGSLTKICVKTFKLKPGPLLMYGLIMLVALFNAVLDFGYDASGILTDATIRNLHTFALDAVGAIVIALIHWMACWEHYFYGSEYEARVELLGRGYSKDRAEKEITTLRGDGIFGN